MQSSPRKFHRNYSELTLPNHNPSAPRKVSLDDARATPHPRPTATDGEVAARFQFKLTSEVLSFEMEEQRSRQMRTISSHPALLAYYQCFKRLFQGLFEAARLMREDISPRKQQDPSFLLLRLLLGEGSEWTAADLMRAQQLARNIHFLAHTSAEFDRRIDLVARKVVLLNTRRPRIENAFLNKRVGRRWAAVRREAGEWVEGEFGRAEERLCVLEMQKLVRERLSEAEWGQRVQRECVVEEIDSDMNFDFKFEFLLTEELCFGLGEELFREEPPSLCLVM